MSERFQDPSTLRNDAHCRRFSSGNDKSVQVGVFELRPGPNFHGIYYHVHLKPLHHVYVFPEGALQGCTAERWYGRFSDASQGPFR